MKKKKTKKKRHSNKVRKAEEQNASSEGHANDYGGIPERDLKKNLGC